MLTGLIEFFTRTQTPAFIVGGCLRDSLLSLPPGRDVDIAVAGDVQILAKEQAGIKTLVSLARKYRSLSAEIAEVRPLLGAERDDEMADLARSESWTNGFRRFP